MSLLDTLKKESIAGLVIYEHGYTAHLNPKPNSDIKRARIEGYDSLNEAARTFIEENRIKTVVIPESLPGLLVRMPLVGPDMRDGPIRSYGEVSFDVWGGIAKKLGAETINISDRHFTRAMFGSSRREEDLFKALLQGNSGKLAETLSAPYTPPEFNLEANINVEPFKQLLESIGENQTNLERIQPGLEGDEKWAVNKLFQCLQSTKSIVHWNALDHDAGNISLDWGIDEIRCFMRSQSSELDMAVAFIEGTGETDSHYHQARSEYQYLCDGFEKILEGFEEDQAPGL